MSRTLSNPLFWVPLALFLVGTVAAVFLSQYLTRRNARKAIVATEPKEPPAKATVPGVTFADLAGMDDPIRELGELRSYLASPGRFERLGARLPTGILLYGPPGCGKTLLARALAGETGVPFFYISAASFVERYVGVGAARVRELFSTARSQAPSIVFIDELDAIGRHRHGSSDGDGGREFDNTLNQLLIELDSGVGSAGVLVIAATNRQEMIDPALLRPGRFDRRVLVDLPNQADREQILILHASQRRISPRVDWAAVARDLAGSSAADLANLVNEASLLAARWHREMVSPEDVDEACGRLHMGTGTTPTLDESERRLIAYHEAGHALLCLLLRGMKTPPRISIFSRPNANERSVWSITDGRSVLTKRELQAQLILLLGGRAAELNVFGEPTTRSEDDLAHATTLARKMVERWAMADPVPPDGLERAARQVVSTLPGAAGIAAGGGWGGLAGLPVLASSGPDNRSGGGGASLGGQAGMSLLAGADRVARLLSRAEQAARVILNDHSTQLERIAEALIERETLTGVQLEGIAALALPRAGWVAVSPSAGEAQAPIDVESIAGPISPDGTAVIPLLARIAAAKAAKLESRSLGA